MDTLFPNNTLTPLSFRVILCFCPAAHRRHRTVHSERTIGTNPRDLPGVGLFIYSMSIIHPPLFPGIPDPRYIKRVDVDDDILRDPWSTSNSFVGFIGTGRRWINKLFVSFVTNRSYLEITMILSFPRRREYELEVQEHVPYNSDYYVGLQRRNSLFQWTMFAWH